MSITRLDTDPSSVKQLAAANLKQLLKDYRWSERKAAVRLNLTQGYINRRTTADTELSTSDIVLFAQLFELEPDVLMRKLVSRDPGTGSAGGGLGRARQQGDEPLLHFAPRPRLELGTCRLPASPGNTGLTGVLRPVIRLADRRMKDGHTPLVGGAIISSFPVRAGA